MKTKKLYLVVQDCGDGSYRIRYTLEAKTIKWYEDAYADGRLEYDAPGVDGDGFHYSTLTVPADATYKSLGIDEYSVITPRDEDDEG